MARLDEMRALVRDSHKRLDASLLIQAKVEDSSDLGTNKVRVYRLDIRKNVVVNGFKWPVGMSVFLKELNKELQIVFVDVSGSTLVYGEGVAAATLPPSAQETAAWSIPPLGLTEARLEASTLGGLYVHTNGFMFQGRVHLGGTLDGAGNFDATTYDESVAAYVPATTGYTRWVGRYFDPDDETFHFVAGALEFWPSVAYLSEATLDALDIPVGCYYAGAVALAYAQTTVVGGRFASWREFINKKQAEFSDLMMSADGFPMVDADGYYMLRS